MLRPFFLDGGNAARLFSMRRSGTSQINAAITRVEDHLSDPRGVQILMIAPRYGTGDSQSLIRGQCRIGLTWDPSRAFRDDDYAAVRQPLQFEM